MSALNEIKDRIGSVRSTLKITSAMKLVASSKLHKAEMAIEAVRPYERTLEQILSVVDSYRSDEDAAPKSADAPVAVVAIASNSSLCGAFNSNVIHKVLEVCAEYPSVKIFPIGRRMAEAMTKAGHAAETDYSDIIGKPDYGPFFPKGYLDKRRVIGRVFAIVFHQIGKSDVQEIKISFDDDLPVIIVLLLLKNQKGLAIIKL